MGIHTAYSRKNEILNCTPPNNSLGVDTFLKHHMRKPVMSFSNKQSHSSDQALKVQMGDVELEEVSSIKYLAVHLDKHLTFEEHIKYLIKKVNQRGRLLWKMRPFVSEAWAKYLYTSLIHPIIYYCDYIYDGRTITAKNKLQIAYNNVLRAIKRCPWDFPTKSLRDSLEIDDLATTRRKSTLKAVYRGVYDQGPPEIDNLFEIYQPPRNFRSENMKIILPPRTRTKLGENDIAIQGCKYWNKIPLETKTIQSVDSFKKHLKPYGPIT